MFTADDLKIIRTCVTECYFLSHNFDISEYKERFNAFVRENFPNKNICLADLIGIYKAVFRHGKKHDLTWAQNSDITNRAFARYFALA